MGAREVLTTIREWMTGLRRAVLANRLTSGALFAAAAFIIFSLLIMLVEAVGHFPGGVRAVLIVLWAISALAAFGLGIVWPILKYTIFAPGDQKLAHDYAQRMPSVRDRVLNALQLLERADNAEKEGYSGELVLEAGRSVAEDLKPINPKSLPDQKPVKLSMRVALMAGGVAVLLLIIAGGPLLSAAERVMKPGEEFEPPAPFTLSVQPGNASLVRGDSLVVEVTATGEAPAQITLERIEKGKSASEPITLSVQTPPNPPVNGGGSYRYTYRGITTPFTYWAHEGRVKTERYDVAVQELPGVRFLSLKLMPPSYTGLAEETLEENVGDVSALVGTKVKLSLAATKSLKSAKLEFLNPDTTAADADLRPAPVRDLVMDGSRASGEFTVEQSGYYRIRLTDQEGYENRDLILYRITARPDEAPMITMVQPAQDLDIAANVKVAVVTEALDDYGFTRMTLRYHRTSVFESADVQGDESVYQPLAMEYRLIEPGRAMGEMLWDLTPLDLLPEDQVLFFVEVWDNDRISGPKRARTETRMLRYPSMQEIFEEEQAQAETQQISLADLMKESEEIRKKVDEAVEEFKSNPEMNWERKQELEQLMQKQAAMNELLEKVSQAIEQAQQQAEMRSMFSPSVMDKMQQIQELVNEVITPEMREALRKMAEAMQQPSEEEMRKAMENMQLTQEMFEKALDQTLNMLKQLQMEKKLDELTRRLDELGRQQEKLNEKMDQNTLETAAKNAEEQKKLAQEMKEIEKKLAELAKEMKENQAKAQEQMEQMQKEAQQEQLAEQMEKNSESMSMCQNQSAKKKGRQARRKMAEMANQLQNIKQAMNQEMDFEALMKLEKSRDQLLDLSMRQEQLWKESEHLEPGSPQMAEAAEEQENLKQALSRVNQDLQELSRESMFVTPQLMAAMHRASMQMQQASQATQERDPRTATHYRKQAMAALNEALKQNQNSCSACKSSCNKPNPNSMCNNAGQMAGKQRNIGQQTKELMQGQSNPGQLSMGEQASMQRLAVEQDALARSAKELAEEVAASQQSLGKLDDVAKEMEEVAQDLKNRNVSDRTLQKQEHIESRLLDFQQAQREREFSPKRQARTGIDMVRSSPRELPNKPGQDQLREDLLRALDAKYTPDYEQLIRQYFEALTKFK